jgi:hypothetical protein
MRQPNPQTKGSQSDINLKLDEIQNSFEVKLKRENEMIDVFIPGETTS